jgi:hypothetical protein
MIFVIYCTDIRFSENSSFAEVIDTSEELQLELSELQRESILRSL